MQRSFDQVFQEVSLQGLPVVLCMDRAGLVGGDGAGHHGFLDIAYLRTLPGLVLLSPADELELLEALRFAVRSGKPCAIRYPRELVPPPLADPTVPFELGRSLPLRRGGDVAILAYGVTAAYALQAARLLSPRGIEAAVWNTRFAQPLDETMLVDAFAGGRPVLSVEDHGVAGGFGSAVLERASELGLAASLGRFRRLGIPAQTYVPHGSRAWQLRQVGIDADGIVQAVLEMLSVEAAQPRRATRAGVAVSAQQAG